MDDIQNYIHGLSQAQFHFTKRKETEPYCHSSKDVRRHVRLLDAIALLLVFSATGDVAAVSYWSSSDKVVSLVYAQNERVTQPARLQYIDRLFQNIKTGSNVDQGLEIVISMCKPKILKRAKNLAKSFGLSSVVSHNTGHNLNYNHFNPYHQKIAPALVSSSQMVQGESVANKLDGFLKILPSLASNHATKVFVDILNFAYCLSELTELRNILCEDQVVAIHKLGAYRQGLELIDKAVTKMNLRGQIITIEQSIHHSSCVCD